ncbi:MAG: HAD-IC family P-type ATPase, partial [Coriobacteriales bacterium]|nr:HAD-IC family P-type ATPase [Coriobacteriales bacterium]
VLALTGALKHDEFIAMSFVSLKNDLRPNVKETFAYLAEQGVQVKVISGDAPLTVSSIAQIVGIPGAERYIDASTLTTPEELREAARTYTVFGRVKPDQKKQLVLALKEDGTRVAMTGDGVNDILAMKEADCSIAMGAGSDAAMQSAQVVLLDSDFSHMREIIGEGRRDINNITRSATLFLYKNLFSAMLASFSIILFFSYPLQPTQVTLVSGFNIGLPAFLLAFEPNEKKQKGHFLTEVVLKSMPAAIASFAGIGAMVIFADLFSITAQEVSTASTFLLSAVGFIILKNICTPMNRYRATVMGLCIIGMVACSILFNNLFSISALTPRCLVLTVVFAIADTSIMRWMDYLFNRLRRAIER